MKLYTYGGDTPTEALRKAQQEHGDEALVVENKEIRKKTLSQPGLYEVVVAVREPQDSQKHEESKVVKKANSMQEKLNELSKREMERRRAQRKLDTYDDGVSLQLSNVVREISELSNVDDKANQKLHLPSRQIDSPMSDKLARRIDSKIQARGIEKENGKVNDNKDEIKVIKQELEKLNDKMKLIQNMVWEDRGPKSEGLNIPHEFAEIYRIAKSSGIRKDHLDSVMTLSLELMPLKMRENSLTIRRYFREVLRKMIYCRPESKDSSKKIMMLVGPTGVGKTTALAKLAARFSLEKKARVGIITLDSYRIGALEQLEWYADRMRIGIQMVMAPDDFVKALDSLRYCDYILVDTAGHSQNDCEKINQIKRYLCEDYKINVSLVMSATTKFEDLRDIYDAFGILNIDTLIFSKLDESRELGNIFSLVYDTKKPISYFSIGQEVPTDFMVASNESLVDWLLDGFVNPNK